MAKVEYQIFEFNFSGDILKFPFFDTISYGWVLIKVNTVNPHSEYHGVFGSNSGKRRLAQHLEII